MFALSYTRLVYDLRIDTGKWILNQLNLGYLAGFGGRCNYHLPYSGTRAEFSLGILVRQTQVLISKPSTLV
jgi:hypothetical protein